MRHSGEQAVGAVFWQAGELADVWVDQACVVFWQVAGNQLALTLSIPDGDHAPVHLTWPAELTPVQTPANVTFVLNQGATVIRYDPAPGGNYFGSWKIPAE
ncbi:MAG: polysaccharide lyase beta-sandwich domain-containing protein [Verrucomicrobia bacterium]|nr:polysaccharide lyase beta-sandwich domain-containing protein [Verrucomicrobiota bacterium]